MRGLKFGGFVISNTTQVRGWLRSVIAMSITELRDEAACPDYLKEYRKICREELALRKKRIAEAGK